MDRLDQVVSGYLLADPGATGDLLEIGAFRGRSAVHMGQYCRPEETFTVCDLFDLAPREPTLPVTARPREASQAAFVDTYRRHHDRLPTIVRGHSDGITEHVRPASCRFVHVDASPTYADVRRDLVSAQALLRPGGVVAVAGYRDEDRPGTAAAVWQAVLTGGLRPIAVTSRTLYGTWDDPEPVRARLLAMVGQRGDLVVEPVALPGGSVVRIALAGPARAGVPAPAPRPAPDVEQRRGRWNLAALRAAARRVSRGASS
jgi:hypothetical protein